MSELDDLPPVLLTKQAAKVLGVHVQTIRARIEDGSLPATKHGNRWYIRREALRNFVPAEPAQQSA